MNLTPLDIQKKEFKKSMRGCDPEEVETFLYEVSEFTEKLLFEKEQLESQLSAALSQLDQIKTQSEAVIPEKETNTTVDREAKLIIREAELKALEILENNRAESNRLKDELVVLKQQKNSFIKRLKHLFAAQLDLIDVLEIEDVELDEIKDIQKQKERRRFTSKQIAEVPAFKRQQVEPSSDIDLTKLSSGGTVQDNIPFIKQRAKELLQDKQTSDSAKQAKPENLDLDDILGRIGEVDND
jgi:cell division initiation protein